VQILTQVAWPEKIRWLLITGLCTAVALLFSLAVASGTWVIAAGILGLAAFSVLIMAGLDVVALFWVVGAPTIFVLANNVLGQLPFFTMERFMFLTIAGGLLARHILGRGTLAPLDPAERLLGVFLILAAGLMAYGTLRTGGMTLRMDVALYAGGYLLPFGAYFVARRLNWSAQRLHQLLAGLLLAGVFLSVIGVLQLYAGLETFVPKDMDMTHAGIRDGRATGVFASAGEYGAVLAGLLLVALFHFKRAQDPAARLFFLGLVGVILIGLVLGKTRAPWLGGLAGLLVFFICDRAYRPLLLVGAGLATLGGLIAIPLLADEALLADLDRRFSELSPIFNRLTLWASGVNMVLQNPWGMGFGRYAFLNALPDYIMGIGGISGNFATQATVPHNEFIHVAVLTGVPGIVLFILSLRRIVTVLRTAWRTLPPHSLERDLALLAIANLTVYCVNGLAIDYGNWKYFGILTFFLVGIIASARFKGDVRRPDGG